MDYIVLSYASVQWPLQERWLQGQFKVKHISSKCKVSEFLGLAVAVIVIISIS